MNAQFIVIITLSVIAIAVRLTFLHLYPPVAPYSDMSAYDGLAWRLAQGLGYVTLEGAFTAYWPVGYPAFLSVMYLVCGHEPGCGYFANLVLAAAIVVAVYLLIAKLSGSQTAAVWGALFMALYPDSIAYSGLLLSELLYTALLLVGVVLLIGAIDRIPDSAKIAATLAFLAGVIFGMATLVRPLAALLLLPVVAVLLVHDRPGEWLARRQWMSLSIASKWVFLCILLLGSAIPVSVWSVRNYLVFERFVFVSTNGGVNLLIGNHALADGTYVEDVQTSQLFSEYPDEIKRDAAARQRAMTYIASSIPTVIGELAPFKLQSMFRDQGDGFMLAWKAYSVIPFGDPAWERSGVGVVTKLLIRLRSWAYLFALAGFVLYCVLLIPGRLPWFPVLITLYHIGVTMIFFGATRYREPLIPFWVIGIGCMSAYLLRQWPRISIFEALFLNRG